MSGSGLARCSWGNISRVGPGACVADAHLALLGHHRAHAGAGLVAGALPWQFVGERMEEPGHGHFDSIHGFVGRLMDASVCRAAGRQPAIDRKPPLAFGLGLFQFNGLLGLSLTGLAFLQERDNHGAEDQPRHD